MYITMPLYHTSAGILGVGQTLLRGTSCVIRQKFSASNFWKDCVKYECTVSTCLVIRQLNAVLNAFRLANTLGKYAATSWRKRKSRKRSNIKCV